MSLDFGRQLGQQLRETIGTTDLGDNWGNRSGRQLGQQIWEKIGATDLADNWGNRLGDNWGNEFRGSAAKSDGQKPIA